MPFPEPRDGVPPTVVIGAGWLGAAIATALPGPVVATTRSGRVQGLPDTIDVRPFDVLSATASSRDLLPARCWIFSLAPGREQTPHDVYVRGPRALLDQLVPGDLERIVWLSSTSALPDIDGWVDETCELWPEHGRGRIQRQAEAVVIEACRARGIPYLILRLAGLYGPDRPLERIYRAPVGAPLDGDGMEATNLVHRDDVVAAVVAAVDCDLSYSGIVHVVDDDHCSRRHMFSLMAARARGPAATWTTPADPDGQLRGKQVASRHLSSVLGITLMHPSHGGDLPPSTMP